MRAVRMRVTGQVQGVGFRAFVSRRAAELGLAGWVRNLPDGGVETEAVGAEDALARFVDAVKVGPRLARIEQASEQWFDPAEAPRGFRIEA
jgi:acylphosphatase